ADRLLERTRNQPGVLYATIASSFPMDPENSGGGTAPRVQMEGDTRSANELPALDSLRSASPDYFRTLGLPVLARRGFLDGDNKASEQVVILNSPLARALSKNQDPIGRRISINGGQRWWKVVGVVGDTRDLGPLRGTPLQAYRPLAQSPGLGALMVRTAG